jgi:acyl carrier protein
MSSLSALQTLIHEKYGIDPATLDPGSSMLEKGLDSLALVEFLFIVEEHFKIDLSDADQSTDTLGGLAAVVDRKLAEKDTAKSAA